MGNKIYVNGGILVNTPYFACKNVTCLVEEVPMDAEILQPETISEGAPCLIIDDNHPLSLFNEYYVKSFFSSLYEGSYYLRMSNEECFDEFYNGLNEVEEIAKTINKDNNLRDSIMKLLYINVITCFDVLVCSLILSNIIRDEALFFHYYEHMISKSDKALFSKYLIENNRGGWEKEIVSRIMKVSYCSIKTIKDAFKAMKKPIPNDSGKVIEKHFQNRHILIHRNGKMRNNKVLKVDKALLEKEMSDIKHFAEQLRDNLDSLR